MSTILGLMASCLLASASVPMVVLVPQGAAPGTPGKQGKQDPKKPGAKEQDPKKQYRFRPMPIPRIVMEHRGKRKIRIDGALDEWPKVMPVLLNDVRQVSGTALAAYRDEKDISGQLYMIWDETYVYLALQVLDDWHRPLQKKLRQEIPPVDNAVITFDPNRDTTAGAADAGRREDRSFYLADMQRIGDKLLQWDRRVGTRTLTPGAHCIVDRREGEGVTVFEARIPWTAILPPGQSAKVGRVFDFQVVLNDYDEVTDPVAQTRVGWNFGMGSQIEPGLYGSVMLVREFDGARERFPAFPAPPLPRGMGPGRKYWVDLYNGILATKSAIVDVETPDPGLAGGKERLKLLTDLDGFLTEFPRVANLEYHYRIQRRMVREVSGTAQHGLPFFWDYAIRDVIRRSVSVPPKDAIRVFRLPQGGFYVRSAVSNFVIDPCGARVEVLFLRGGIDFALLTRPTEATRRHDPLLIRMSASKPKRTFFTHLYFHLPGAKPGSMFLVKPEKEYGAPGLKRVRPLGKMTDDGKTTLSMGYLVEWPDGRTLVHAGSSMTQALIKKLGIIPDILILPGNYGPDLARIARDFGARLTILDDALIASEYPDQFGGRITYGQMLRHQNDIKPLRSVILAPGESIDVPKR